MPCTQPCFNCLFSRDADPGLPNDEEPYEFYARHMTGLFVPYICPEQGDVCFGQITMMANLCIGMMMKDHELQDEVYLAEQDWEVYFAGNNEFIRYHREGWIFGAAWLRKLKETAGWVKPKKPEQLSLF